MTALQRLTARIRAGDPRECWPWTGVLNRWGYGQFWMDGKNYNASRAVYLLLVGSIPAGLVVCHRCDNPACCNPGHLWLGTQGDNVRDCASKGRSRGTFTGRTGAAHPRYCAKLTEDQVQAAKARYREGVSQSQIARELRVHSSTISRAVRGEKWAHLK